MHKRILAGAGVAFFSQATGCEAVLYYSSAILDNAGVARQSTLLATVVIGCVKTGAVITSSMLVDRVGRRPLLMLSSGCMCLAMATLGTSVWKQFPLPIEIVALCIFVVGFSLG